MAPSADGSWIGRGFLNLEFVRLASAINRRLPFFVETNDAATGHLGPDAAASLGADPDAREHWVVAIEADVEEWEELRDDGGSYVPEEG